MAVRLLTAVAIAVTPSLGAAFGASQGAPDETASQRSAQSAATAASERERLVDDLTERYELGLQAEVIETGRSLVADGGPLAQDGRAVATVARALFDGGFEDEADRLLARTDLVPSTLPLVELERARLALLRDDLELARRLLSAEAGAAVPVRHPEYADSWLLMARVFARGGRLDLAAQLARKMLELAPLHPEASSAWHLLSREAVARRDAAAADEYLKRAEFSRTWNELMRARRLQVRMSPTEPLPRLGLALGWMQVERWSRAEVELLALLSMDPGYCRAYFHLGEARRLDGRAEEAVAAYSKGLECDPADMRMALNRGLLHQAAGDVDAAIADLEKVSTSASADEPQFLAAHLELARMLASRGRDEEAAEAYRRYLRYGGTEEL